MNASMTVDSYYERVDEQRYKPSHHVSGAWDTAEQHFSPLGGLIVHAMDRYRSTREGADLVLARISFDILGQIALAECDIQVETIRAGRTIELLEATVRIGDRVVVRARAWLLASIDTSAVAGGALEPLTPPTALDNWPASSIWPGGFIASLEVRPLAPPQPGRTTAWIGTKVDLVAGEAVSPLAAFIGLVDTANGIAVRQPPTAWLYPNVDLTIHLHRQPEGRWTGLDTTVIFGTTGQGITSTVLHDIAGPVGYAQQILTIRPQ